MKFKVGDKVVLKPEITRDNCVEETFCMIPCMYDLIENEVLTICGIIEDEEGVEPTIYIKGNTYEWTSDCFNLYEQVHVETYDSRRHDDIVAILQLIDGNNILGHGDVYKNGSSYTDEMWRMFVDLIDSNIDDADYDALADKVEKWLDTKKKLTMKELRDIVGYDFELEAEDEV